MDAEDEDLDAVLAESFIEGLADLSMDEVRARRSACEEIEVGLSYLRRLVQGRLDIVRAEARARSLGEDHSLAAMVEQLPEILAPGVVGGGSGRLAGRLEPTSDYRGLTADLDRIIDVGGLGRLAECPDAEVATVAAALSDLERAISVKRRTLHDRLDVIQAEIVRRYRSGEISVDSLL